MRYVKTDYDGCPYITAGKVYEISKSKMFKGFLCIKSDEGLEVFLTVKGNVKSFVNKNRIDWTECDAEGNEIGGGDE